VLEGIDRESALLAECGETFGQLAGRAPDHRLTRSVVDYLSKWPSRLAAERADAATEPYDREATRAEVLDATVCRAFHHLLYQGEVRRLALMVGDAPLADAVEARLAERIATLARESDLRVLPLRPLVSVQAAAGLLALDAVVRGALDEP
jgi:hypothetical protein